MNKFDLGESEGGWGKQNDNGTYDDMWGVDELRSKVNEGWFVASKSEWAAFGDVATELGVRMDNYNKYGLSEWYWSSSQIFTYGAYYPNFFEWCLNYDFVSSNGFVRLSAIF